MISITDRARGMVRVVGVAAAVLVGFGPFVGRGASTAHADTLEDPTGTWLVKDGDARIRIDHCPRPHDKICGYIVWTKDAPTGDKGKDDKNPDAAKRARPVMGMQMLMGLAPDGDVYSGPIYNAENGKTYDAHIHLEDPTHLILKGCVLKYLCQSQTWTKVDDVAAGQLEGHTDEAGGPKTDAEWVQPKPAGHKAKQAKH